MTNLISVAGLRENIGQQNLLIADCRFDVADPVRGPRNHAEGHIPGAVYAHLDEDLSTPASEHGGRHPLPSIDRMAALFGRLGIASGRTRVVVYDDAGGSYAARLWWMLRYLGHREVQLLDGGWQAWLAGGGPVETTSAPVRPALFTAEVRHEMLADVDDVRALGPGSTLIDSRAPERYRGETEPLDAKAGHIPGAVNHPWMAALGPDQRLLPPERLRESFGELSDRPVVYCGSGVTACINVLALEEAGYGMPRLYGGSWSDWISWSDNPIATGPA
jgi:thiosulfate/3-mercaptopyruvate sulfurtransferase